MVLFDDLGLDIILCVIVMREVIKKKLRNLLLSMNVFHPMLSDCHYI